MSRDLTTVVGDFAARWRLVRLAAGVSAVLCAASVALWVRSHRVEDFVGHVRVTAGGGRVSEYRHGLFSAGGRVSLAEGRWAQTEADFVGRVSDAPAGDVDRTGWDAGRPGEFHYFYGERDDTFLFAFGGNWMGDPDGPPGDNDYYEVHSVPHWYLVLLFAVLPVWAFLAGGRRNRRPWVPAAACGGVVVAGVLMVATNGWIAYLLPLAAPTVAVGAAVVTVVRHPQTRIARRLAAGQCPECGYDLRASPDRCPECGTARRKAVGDSPDAAGV